MPHLPIYKTFTGTPTGKLRSTYHQTDTNLLYVPGTFKDHNGNDRKLEGIVVLYASLHNRSGGAANVGIGWRVPNRLWIAGQWDDTGGATQYSDDTTAAQDTVTDDFPLETTTNNDGYVVASRERFNCVTLNVSTASADATNPTRAVRYSDSAGTGWTNFTATDFYASDGTGAAEYTTGEQLLVFNTPWDWGRTSSLGDIPDGYYAVNVRATTAPDTTAGIAASIELWNIHLLTEALGDNGTLEFAGSGEPLWERFSDGLSVFFSTASAMNRATVQVRMA